MGSLSNAAEASLAAVLYMKICASGVSRRVTVGVVTPYKDQIAELRRKFEPLIKGRPEARVTRGVHRGGVQGEFDASYSPVPHSEWTRRQSS